MTDKPREPFTEGLRFIRSYTTDGCLRLIAVLPNWVGWHQAAVLEDRIQVPAQLLTGERVVIEMSNSFILTECEAPSVAEFLAKKQADYPPTGDNTYSWA